MTTLKGKGNSKPDIDSVVTAASTIRKGLLWQQKESALWNRWKERYFILTKDYLTCFKKASSLSFIGSEMGSFHYKIQLCEIANIDWKRPDNKKHRKCSNNDSKNQKEVISIVLLASNDRIDLWSNSKATLNEWMYALKDATCKSRDRRAALIKKSQTLCIPQSVPTQPFALSLWTCSRDEKKPKKQKKKSTSSDDSNPSSNTDNVQNASTESESTNSSETAHSSKNELNDLSIVLQNYSSLRISGGQQRGTPILNRNSHRISILSGKDLELVKERDALSTNGVSSEDETNSTHAKIFEPALGPRLAPQCKGISNLVSLDRRLMPQRAGMGQAAVPIGLGQPCPRSLQVSPALTQRSSYAQHILSTPEIISPMLSYATNRRTREDLLRQVTGRNAPTGVLKSATSEFSFIRPDSPLTLPYNKSKSFYGRPQAVPPVPPVRGTSQSQLASIALRDEVIRDGLLRRNSSGAAPLDYLSDIDRPLLNGPIGSSRRGASSMALSGGFRASEIRADYPPPPPQRRLPEPPPRASTLNRGLTGIPSAFVRGVGSGHHTLMQASSNGRVVRPSSYHYEGESLDDVVAKLKLNDRRTKRMNRILEKTSQQFTN